MSGFHAPFGTNAPPVMEPHVHLVETVDEVASLLV